jgi:hypothetical protein
MGDWDEEWVRWIFLTVLRIEPEKGRPAGPAGTSPAGIGGRKKTAESPWGILCSIARPAILPTRSAVEF